MKSILAATALTAALVISGAAFAQSGGDAGSANKNIGAAAPVPNNQSGTTDSKTTGATAMNPGGASTGKTMKKKTASGAKMKKMDN